MTVPIIMTPRAYETLLNILRQYLPDATIWAYGSRVKGNARPSSDIDLVTFSDAKPRWKFGELIDALEESDLPFRVNLLIWDEIPQSYRREIERHYVALPGRIEDQGDNFSSS